MFYDSLKNIPDKEKPSRDIVEDDRKLDSFMEEWQRKRLSNG